MYITQVVTNVEKHPCDGSDQDVVTNDIKKCVDKNIRGNKKVSKDQRKEVVGNNVWLKAIKRVGRFVQFYQEEYLVTNNLFKQNIRDLYVFEHLTQTAALIIKID